MNNNQTHKYREQTSDYQWGEGRGVVRGVEDEEEWTIMYKINTQASLVVQW